MVFCWSCTNKYLFLLPEGHSFTPQNYPDCHLGPQVNGWDENAHNCGSSDMKKPTLSTVCCYTWPNKIDGSILFIHSLTSFCVKSLIVKIYLYCFSPHWWIVKNTCTHATHLWKFDFQTGPLMEKGKGTKVFFFFKLSRPLILEH